MFFKKKRNDMELSGNDIIDEDGKVKQTHFSSDQTHQVIDDTSYYPNQRKRFVDEDNYSRQTDYTQSQAQDNRNDDYQKQYNNNDYVDNQNNVNNDYQNNDYQQDKNYSEYTEQTHQQKSYLDEDDTQSEYASYDSSKDVPTSEESNYDNGENFTETSGENFADNYKKVLSAENFGEVSQKALISDGNSIYYQFEVEAAFADWFEHDAVHSTKEVETDLDKKKVWAINRLTRTFLLRKMSSEADKKLDDGGFLTIYHNLVENNILYLVEAIQMYNGHNWKIVNEDEYNRRLMLLAIKGDEYVKSNHADYQRAIKSLVTSLDANKVKISME